MARCSPKLIESTVVNLDHVGVAVCDAADTLSRMQSMGLLLPVAGEEEDAFRYVIGRREQPQRGIRLELLDPCDDETGFLASYLRRAGEGAHHLTFMVDDLAERVGLLQHMGVEVTQLDLSYPPWQEAFIHPREGLGTVVQLGSSIHCYPWGSAAEGTVDSELVPHRRAGRNRHWWKTDGSASGAPVIIVGIELGCGDPVRTRVILEQGLGGRPVASADGIPTRLAWVSGYIDVVEAVDPYIRIIHGESTGRVAEETTIGRTAIRSGGRPPAEVRDQ